VLARPFRALAFFHGPFGHLTTGFADTVKSGPLFQGDLMYRASIDAAFAQDRPFAMIDLTNPSLVGEAMTDPGKLVLSRFGACPLIA
jgi:UDP-glucose 4-epimerase